MQKVKNPSCFAYTVASWVKRDTVGKAENCTFSTDRQTFQTESNSQLQTSNTEEIMGAQNLNFAPKFPQNEDFATQNFAYLDKHPWTRTRFSSSNNPEIARACSPVMTPLSTVDCNIWMQILGPNFRNFLGRSLEDFFTKESMWIFETSFENVFGRIWEDDFEMILKRWFWDFQKWFWERVQFSIPLWKLLRKN